jgi:uncharacterized membrane protein
MGFFTNFLIISIFLGPGLAISYGMENPSFRPAAHLFTLMAFQCLGIAIVYILLRVLPTDIRFNNKVLDKVVDYLHDTRDGVVKTLDNVTSIFKKNFGDLGFYAALGFISFAYGVYIAAAVAYVLKVKIRRAMVSISIGGAIAIVFWYFLALGYIPFITPVSVFIAVTGLSAVMMIYGYSRENRTIRRIAGQVIERRQEIKKHRHSFQREVVKTAKLAGKEAIKGGKAAESHARKAAIKSKEAAEDFIEKGSQRISQL